MGTVSLEPILAAKCLSTFSSVLLIILNLTSLLRLLSLLTGIKLEISILNVKQQFARQGLTTSRPILATMSTAIWAMMRLNILHFWSSALISQLLLGLSTFQTCNSYSHRPSRVPRLLKFLKY